MNAPRNPQASTPARGFVQHAGEEYRANVAAALPWFRIVASWSFVGGLLIALVYQIPARHDVQVGYNDASYVQGFGEPLNRWGVLDSDSQAQTPLRWSTAQSALIFPQIGLPAQATIRWRALRPADAPPTTVRVWLNGRQELGVFQASDTWETHTFSINSGLLKLNDLFLELRTEPLIEIDGVLHGVQVDQVSLATSGWPILPYPTQLIYGGLAAGLGATYVRRRSHRLLVTLLVALLFLVFYRLQLSPLPIRTLPPMLVLVMSALTLVRAAPAIRLPAWTSVLMILGVVLLWLVWLLQTAQSHVVLSVPGVENDFRVFATRSMMLRCPPDGFQAGASCVLRADGFYQLGYPLLLWLIRPFTSANAFLAARLVATISGTVVMMATAALGWRIGGFVVSMVAVAALALSPLVVQYSLYLGTDLPFAALWLVSLALLCVPRRMTAGHAMLAGAACGLTFMVRHPGLVLLPLGWIVLVLLHAQFAVSEASPRNWRERIPWRLCGGLTLGWLLTSAPQIVVNLRDTGNPLFSQQAKNIWLAVYGNVDWGRWNEASNTVGLSQLVLADPARFFGNWSRNIQIFIGTGANDTSEFGQALALRLLAFPANWLALIGLAIWCWQGNRRQRLLLGAAGLYVLGVSIGFMLLRFFVPLAPIWAIASATAVVSLAHRSALRWRFLQQRQWMLVISMIVLVLMAQGPQTGARYVLEHQNPEAALVAKVLLERLQPGERVAFVLPPEDTLDKYSAVAHVAVTNQQEAAYIVWSTHAGEGAAELINQEPLAVVGPYTIIANK